MSKNTLCITEYKLIKKYFASNFTKFYILFFIKLCEVMLLEIKLLSDDDAYKRLEGDLNNRCLLRKTRDD